MTHDKTSVKIKNIRISLKQNRINLNLEVKAEIGEHTHNPLGTTQKRSRQKRSMKELNVSLKDVAYYLIQLFCQTGRKYSCSRSKIGKLLSIVAFTYAREGYVLFRESIYKYDTCGTYIPELQGFIDREAYIGYCFEDNEGYIDDEFNHEYKEIERYKYSGDLDETIKLRVELVFRYFGAFKAYDLGKKLLNPIINYPNVTNSIGKIDLDYLKGMDSLFLSEKQQENKLCKLLLQYKDAPCE